MRSKIFSCAVVAVLGFLLVTNPVVTDAAATITGKDIKNSSVTGKDIKNKSLKGKDVKDGSVTGSDLKDLSLSGTDNLVRVASASDDFMALSNTTTESDVLSLSIVAPARGYLVITASSDTFNLVEDVTEVCWLRVDGVSVPASFREIQLSGNTGGNTEENCGTDGTVPVAAGNHTVAFRAEPSSLDTVYDESSLQAVFVPFGPTGAAPTPKQVAKAQSGAARGHTNR